MPDCYILIGIPASGKSTWVRKYGGDMTVISPDGYLEEQYQYEWTEQRAKEAWAHSYQEFADSLRQGRSVVWDATFLGSIDRSPVLNLAKGFGYKCTAIVVQAPLELCLQRNLERHRSPVPSSKIVAMHKSLCLPSLEEGFDDIELVDAGS